MLGMIAHPGVCSTLRSECKARGLVPRRARDEKSPTVPPSCPFRYATRVFRERTKGGVQGTYFIIPRTPFRMVSSAICLRPSSKAGLCPIRSGCAS